MNTSKFLSITLAVLFFFIQCKKEYSFEGGATDKTATGSLRSTSGNCHTAIVNGVYKQDSALDNTNSVVITVHFTSPGQYKIFTDTQNGFYFQDSSYITDTGYIQVTLKAKGKPAVAQTTNFSVVFDTSTCSFSVPVIGATPATYTLAGSPNACANFIVKGSYNVGQVLSSLNTVALQVNVTSIGSYSISTSAVNGMTFSASGNFTNTGLQQVLLQAVGRPQVAGNNVIPVSVGSSTCNFTINVGAANSSDTTDINLAASAWEFVQGSNSFHGYFDGALSQVINGSTVVTLVGLTPTKDTAIAILINIAGSSAVKTGTYKSSSSSTFVFFDHRGTNIYYADSTTTAAELTIALTAYNAVTQIIEGSFSGTVLNQMNSQVVITAGKFKAKLN